MFQPNNKSFGLNLPKPAKLTINGLKDYQITNFKDLKLKKV